MKARLCLASVYSCRDLSRRALAPGYCATKPWANALRLICKLLLLLFLFLLPSKSINGQDSKKVDKAMELSGLSVSESFQVSDYRPLNPGNTIFRKLFYRVGQTANSNLETWSKLSIEAGYQQLLDEPGKSRFQVFAGTATAHSIEKIEFERQAEGFPNALYVVQCTNSDGLPIAIVLRQPIGAWPLDQPLTTPQQIRYCGFFLGSFETDDGELIITKEHSDEEEVPSIPARPTSAPVFVARRIAWLPTAVSESPQVTPSMVELASKGVDVSGLRDTILPRSAKPLGQRETQLFYQLMKAAAVSKSPPEDVVDFSELMRNPKGLIGNAIELTGRIKQCVPVVINDQPTRTSLGADQWYQATLFPDMKNKAIVIKNPKGEDEVYTSFPVTLCLKELPTGLTPKTFEGKSFSIDGYYYRMWIYPSERTDNSGLSGQVSPLVMVGSLTEIQASEAQLDQFIAAVVGAMLLAVVAIAFFVFRSKQSVARNAEPLPDVINTNFD